MQQLHPLEDGTSGQSLALQKFATLTLEDQLPILAFILRDELSSCARGTRRRAHRHVRPLAPAPAPAAPAAPAAAEVRAAPPAAREKLEVIEAALALVRQDAAPRQPRQRRSQIAGPVLESAAHGRPLSILVTMAASFVLAFGLMWWQRQPRVQAASIVDTIAAPEPVSAPVGPAAPLPPPAPVATPSPQAPAAARNRPADTMPVTLQFRRRGFHADPGDRNKINWYMQGRVTNLSDTPMNIEVKVESAAALSANQIQIDVAAHEEREFGVDDGLEMHPGDRVTLLSAPYSDLVVGGVH